jgi:protein-disulfide isomerase
MHDRLFDAERVDSQALTVLASSLKLGPAFDHCTGDENVIARVMQDASFGKSLGVQGTPSFFIGKKMPNGMVKVEQAFSGARPLDDFRTAIESFD